MPENVAEPTNISQEPLPMAEVSIRGANETKEQFEQRVLTERTSELLTVVERKFAQSKKPKIAFDQLTVGCRRKMVRLVFMLYDRQCLQIFASCFAGRPTILCPVGVASQSDLVAKSTSRGD